MNSLLLNAITIDDPTQFGLVIAMIVVGVLIGIALIWSFITRIIVMVTYSKYNKIANSAGYTAREAAYNFLVACGVEDVKVEQCSFWRAFLFVGGTGFGLGNSYSIYKKIIFLRKGIIDKNSVTAVAIATQKVGLAYQHKTGDKKYIFTARLKPFLLFAPYGLIPLSLLGLVLDMFVFKTGGFVYSIIFAFIGAVLFLLSFLVTFFTISIEKRANNDAIQLMEQNNFLTAEERVMVKKLYNAYMMGYIADFVISTLYLIMKILQILAKISKFTKKR